MRRRDQSFVAEVRRVVDSRTQPTIAVLASGEREDPVAPLLRAVLPGARVLGFDTGSPLLHVELARQGRFDVVVDASRKAGRRGAILRDTWGHVRSGGAYLVYDHRAGHGQRSRCGADALAPLLARVVAVRLGREPAPRGDDDAHALASSLGDLRIVGPHVSLTVRSRAMAKLGELDVEAFLNGAPERGRVLHRMPGAVVESRAVLRQSPGADLEGPGPEDLARFDAPPLMLREYVTAVCWPGQVVTQGNVMLPESYRHVRRPRLWNKYADERGPRFAVPRRAGAVRHLEGAYFHLDSEYRGHFGHALTEQLSRLWAWAEARRQVPDLKALVLENVWAEVAPFERDLYQAAGVNPRDLVLVQGPVRVDRLLGATPSFTHPAAQFPREGGYVHPLAAEVWARTGDALAALAPERDYPARIFCSRRRDKRACQNTPLVEEFFTARGYTVVYPEDFSIAEQVGLFRGAERAAGFAGSAMFTLMFCPTPKPVLLLSPETYTARNEHLIAALLGHRVDTVWCRSVRAGMQAPYVFDPGREGPWIDDFICGA